LPIITAPRGGGADPPTANKTYEAKVFSDKKEIAKKYELVECDFRI
jgi:hypothetical protein